MAKISKKLEAARAKVDANKVYSLEDAIKLAQETSYTKFDGSIDLAFTLNLDVRQADQQLRGAVTLPNGNGKTIKVLAATDENTDAVKAAGADIVVSGDELNNILKSGKYDFDIIVTSPKMMPVLGRYGKELGPKGLMPNPKTGTVTPNVAKAIEEIKKGKANYRTDKNGIIHTSVGKVSMTTEKLVENAKVVIDTIKKLKPAAVKGTYIKNLTVSASMGPSVKFED